METQIENDTLFRQISIVAVDVGDKNHYQMSLFEKPKEDREIYDLEETLIQIRKKYGSVKAMPCSALSLSSTYLKRRNQIGGHHA